MKSVLSVITAALLSVATPGAAESPVVVELFTSQGCSSCPPADRIFAELARRDDVIALALHVDYWDYIGWKDELAVPAYADRQRGYAAAAHRRSIYTPQMVVNGQTDIVGARPMELSEVIAEHAAIASPVTLGITRDGDVLNISAQTTGAPGQMTVQLVRYTPMTETSITRGENAGMTLQYANVAHDWQVLDTWDGSSDLAMSTRVTGDAPLVVLIQLGAHGAILAADALR
ncbi:MULTISPECIES: DUF1223 domain-containing protein [Roseobacteraceae]|jgi:hypothetical protein|uniref:Secreted protein n=1 Tax=Pseudosulfitobacter pseudonitzschiae TaxID=1402135 RepID=A0A221JYR4_9RHOB|nr:MULTISPECIES: DUF1223 domain-containing protein [Roseobacteraceae]ASM71876.1 hypothetical protein SULPSESMR1_01050 [Pseudosulfitobacter pseudonitzschiae]